MFVYRFFFPLDGWIRNRKGAEMRSEGLGGTEGFGSPLRSPVDTAKKYQGPCQLDAGWESQCFIAPPCWCERVRAGSGLRHRPHPCSRREPQHPCRLAASASLRASHLQTTPRSLVCPLRLSTNQAASLFSSPFFFFLSCRVL